MANTYGRGSKVSWKWGNCTGAGTFVEVHEKKLTKTLKGSEITRNGSADCAAYLVEDDDGTQVLKLHGELVQSGTWSGEPYSYLVHQVTACCKFNQRKVVVTVTITSEEPVETTHFRAADYGRRGNSRPQFAPGHGHSRYACTIR